MSVKDLKEQIKQRIDSSDDEQLLSFIDKLLDSRLEEDETVNFSAGVEADVEEARAQYKAGKSYTEEQERELTKRWFEENK